MKAVYSVLRTRKFLTASILVIFLLALLSSCSVKKTDNSDSVPVIMGSVVTVQLYGGDEKLKSDVIDEIKRVDSVISKNNIDSELYKINQNSGKENKISEELLSYIWDTTEIYSLSENKLSVTSGALTQLWGIDTEEFNLPEKSEIDKAIPLCYDSNINVRSSDNGLNTTIFVKEGQLFNLGSVGKGIACDKAVEILSKSSDCEGAVISVGGSVAVYGTHNGRSGWNVGIRDPYGKASDIFATLTLANCYISTSGNYEKKFEIDGKMYHHILDLTTGYPAENDLSAVTVVAKSGLESDALSTLCYALGEERSRELLEFYEAKAVFIYSDKTVSVTDGLLESLEITNSEYTLK